MRIAVDFDGVLVKNRYPEIGEERTGAIEALIKLQKNGHQLILWTHRAGIELKAAINFCRERGLIFFAVNQNYPGEIFTEGTSRKVRADFYIENNFLSKDFSWTDIFMYIQLMSMG
jgi:hypothetical protein